MSHPHTIADIAALVQVPAGALRELADNWANFAAEYDQAAGRVTDAGRDQLLAAYTDDLLEEHGQLRLRQPAVPVRRFLSKGLCWWRSPMG